VARSNIVDHRFQVERVVLGVRTCLKIDEISVILWLPHEETYHHVEISDGTFISKFVQLW